MCRWDEARRPRAPKEDVMRVVLSVLTVLFLVAAGSPALAGEAAQALRKAQGLAPITPGDKFLAGNFVADETNPSFIFGPVKAFVSSRTCPTTWLVEEGEKARMASQDPANRPAEFTLYLEEECPDKVVYYVFVDQSALTPQQWIDWRQQFHKSKADQEFSQAKGKLEHALQESVCVAGELRFILVGGDVQTKPMEQVLRDDLKFPAIYDLSQQKKLSK
jgi:hypothetical protein